MFLQRGAAAAVPFSWAAQRRAGGDRRVLWRVAVGRPSARPRLSEVEVLLGRFRASTSTSLWTSSHPKHSRSPQRSSTITLRPRLHASSRRPPDLRCTPPPLCPAPASAACSSSDESCSPFLRPPDRLQESSLDILAPTQPSSTRCSPTRSALISASASRNHGLLVLECRGRALPGRQEDRRGTPSLPRPSPSPRQGDRADSHRVLSASSSRAPTCSTTSKSLSNS